MYLVQFVKNSCNLFVLPTNIMKRSSKKRFNIFRDLLPSLPKSWEILQISGCILIVLHDSGVFFITQNASKQVL